MNLEKIIEEYEVYLKGKILSDHTHASQLYKTIVELINEYTVHKGDYPFEESSIYFKQRYHLFLEGDINLITLDPVIKNFLINNKINDGKEFKKLIDIVSQFSYSIPCVVISKKYEDIRKSKK